MGKVTMIIIIFIFLSNHIKLSWDGMIFYGHAGDYHDDDFDDDG